MMRAPNVSVPTMKGIHWPPRRRGTNSTMPMRGNIALNALWVPKSCVDPTPTTATKRQAAPSPTSMERTRLSS